MSKREFSAGTFRMRLARYVQLASDNQVGIDHVENALKSERDLGLTDRQSAALEARLDDLGYLEVGQRIGLQGNDSTIRDQATRLVKGAVLRILIRRGRSRYRR